MFSKPEENIRCKFENHSEPDIVYTHIHLHTKCMWEYHVKQQKNKDKKFLKELEGKKICYF